MPADGTQLTRRETGELGLPERTIGQCGSPQALAPNKTAYAKHGYGWAVYRGREATTFVFSDADCTRPLGWITGHVPHGHVWEYSLCERYALTLVGAAVAERVAA